MSVIKLSVIIMGLLIAPFCVSKSLLVLPSKTLKNYCAKNQCDYQVFYQYLSRYKSRFCDERAVIASTEGQYQLFKEVLFKVKDEKLPLSTSMIPIIESSLNRGAKGSGFNAALGLWQIKPVTAKDLGLIVNNEVDERLDPVKSTKAALHYVKWLNHKFNGDHNLAILAYHIGIGNLTRLIGRYKTKNPWFISQRLSRHKPGKNYLLKYYSYAVILLGYEKCYPKEQSKKNSHYLD